MLAVRIILLLLSLVIASYFDIKNHKIPNKLTLPLIVVSTILFVLNPLKTALDLLSIPVLFFLGVFGVMGFGDVKLLMSVSLMFGYKFTFQSIVLALISLVIYVLIKDAKCVFDALINLNRISSKSRRYAFAPFILVGCVCTLFCTYQGWFV